MLLLPAADARDAATAAACCPLGLQTLLAAATPSSSSFPTGGGNVATRTIAASPRAVRCLAGSGAGAADGCDGKEEREGEGCWVSYGWRRRPRRLPPPIPSLRAPLARERTADGRLVISREEAAHRVGARKVEDRRLVLELVDGERDGGAAPPAQQQQRRRSHPLAAGQGATSKQPPATAAGEEEAGARAPAAASPVPAGACFEGAIRAASLRGMRMSLPRMVH